MISSLFEFKYDSFDFFYVIFFLISIITFYCFNHISYLILKDIYNDFEKKYILKFYSFVVFIIRVLFYIKLFIPDNNFILILFDFMYNTSYMSYTMFNINLNDNILINKCCMTQFMLLTINICMTGLNVISTSMLMMNTFIFLLNISSFYNDFTNYKILKKYIYFINTA